jgi:hypothetical protein
LSTVDLKDLLKSYADEQAAILEPGDYTLEVTRCTVRNDNALFPIFKVIGGPDAGKTAMLGPLSLTEKAANIFFRNLKGLGVEPDFFTQYATVPDALKAAAEAIKGRIVEIQVEKREWNGEDRNSFKPGRVKLVSMGRADGTPAGIPQAAPPAPVQAAPPVPPAAPLVQAPPPLPPAPPATGDAPPF